MLHSFSINGICALKKVIYLPSSSPETWDNALVGELGLVLACTPGWWNRRVSVSRCLFPVAEWEWHRGNKKGLVKPRACGKVNADRDGGGQQNSVKTITSHSLLKIVLNQWNVGKLNNSYIGHLPPKKNILWFYASPQFSAHSFLCSCPLMVSQLWELLWNSLSTHKWVCNMSQLFRVRFMIP